MNLSRILKLEKFIADNSPNILTAIGVAGTVTTAILTGKATLRASDILEEHRILHKKNDHYERDARETVYLVWKEFIPPVGMGVITISSIILANRIGTRRAAALAAAYSVSERAFSEYREKVSERLGAGKETEIRDELAQERISRDPTVNKKSLWLVPARCFVTTRLLEDISSRTWRL